MKKNPKTTSLQDRYSLLVHRYAPLRIFSNLFAFMFIIVGTIAVFAYANGYRFSRDDLSVRPTGVITITSSPSNTPAFLNGELKGNTEETIASLDEDIYSVRLKRDNYRQWQRDVYAPTERSTPVHAYLFLNRESYESETLLEVESGYIESVFSPNHNYLFTLTQETTADSEEEETLRIWRTNTSPRFWDALENPRILAEAQIPSGSTYKMIPDSDGDQLVLIVNSGEKGSSIYLLDTSSRYSELSEAELPLSQFIEKYTITWAKDNRHIILESEADLISYDIEDRRRAFLYRKSSTEEIAWQTDKDAYIYYAITPRMSETENTPDELSSSIYRQNLDGTDPEVLVESLKLTPNKLADTPASPEAPLLRSFKEIMPDELELMGNYISQMHIDSNSNSMIFMTDTNAAYYYNTDQDFYNIISESPLRFNSYNPQSSRALFDNGQQIVLFTFLKEEEQDHTIKLGTRTLTETSEPPSEIMWHPNGDTVFYKNQATTYVIDVKGFNKYDLFEDITNEQILGVSMDGDHILALTSSPSNNDLKKINKIRIH